MFKLTQETIAIVSVGATLAAFLVAIAALVITLNSDIRAEARADREAFRSEMQAARAEARADREAAAADREAFEQHIIRLTQEQSRLTGIVEQMRTAASR